MKFFTLFLYLLEKVECDSLCSSKWEFGNVEMAIIRKANNFDNVQ